jgi:segregation and condensation protein A
MKKEERINQSQFYDLITGEEFSWQAIIYDLIKTEQLNPWDIEIGVLADRYVEKIAELEDDDFFISSKVLLACALLLRLKSEILANSYIQELNDSLFGGKEMQVTLGLENFIIEEGELPILIPKTPMARHKKVTLEQLMGALNHAMNTENRRIKRHIKSKQAERSALVVMPKTTLIPLKVRVKNIFSIVQSHFNVNNEHIGFHELAKDREEKLATFLPVLHLSNQEKVHLHQPVHFEEIYIRDKIHPDEKADLENVLGLVGDEGEIVDELVDGGKKLEEEEIFEDLADGAKALELEEGERGVHIGDTAMKVGEIS